jgi:hypothetical protein
MKHKHHIIPRYEGGSNLSKNLVVLTTTQHAMWHFAEWQRKQNQRDYLAWKCLSGQIGKEELQMIKSKLGWEKMISSRKTHPATGNKGKPKTKEHREAISKALKDRGIVPPTKLANLANQKLTDEEVLYIRNSTETGVFLSKKFNVSTSLISRIRLNKCRRI